MTTTEQLLCRDDCPNLEQHVITQDLTRKPDDPANGAPARLLALLNTWLWVPGQTLIVSFLNGSPWQQNTVASYAEEWSEYANINFRFNNHNKYPQIRISFESGFNSSRIGRDALNAHRGEPTMRLGSIREGLAAVDLRRAVLHEFGHALGCLHEHQHPDAALTWNLPELRKHFHGEGWKDEEIYAQIINRYDRTNTQYSDYDPDSIMIYPIPENCLGPNNRIDYNINLSPRDKASIAKLYPK